MSDEPCQPKVAAEPSRRDFLVAAGFAVSAAALSGCAGRPAEKAIPYLVPPDDVTPGVATWYATLCGGCAAGCGALAKCQDGRPIKLEGLPDHPVSAGGLCAVGQASLVGLYDSRRLAGPQRAEQGVSWATLDAAVAAELAAIRQRGGAIRLLTGTVSSLTELAWIERFVDAFGARWVSYDALSASAIAEAHEATHGAWVIPGYRFDEARVIVSFDADFLGTWISPVQFTRQYTAGRDLRGRPPRCSHHVQVESRLSLTGARADVRLRLDGDQVEDALVWLGAEIARRAGQAGPRAAAAPPDARLHDVAERLWAERGRGLVVCGRNDRGLQVIVNGINHLLGNYGRTLSWRRRSYQRQGDDAALAELLAEAQRGEIDALIIAGGNPLAELPGAGALAKVPFLVVAATHRDETAQAADWLATLPHPLETWRDSEAVGGTISLGQPVIRPFGETRSLAGSLAAWCGQPTSDEELVRAVWRDQVYPDGGEGREFEEFWQQAVRDGFVSLPTTLPRGHAFDAAVFARAEPETRLNGLRLDLYAAVAMLDGRHAENPWLHELPDPITKATWDNHACLSPATAESLGLEDGDLVEITAGSGRLELPALVQPGQADGVVAVALGYGRAGSARFADLGPDWIGAEPSVNVDGLVGVNAAPLLRLTGARLGYQVGDVSIRSTGRRRRLALTQTYAFLDVPAHLAPEAGARRPMIQETTLGAYAADPSAGGHEGHHVEGELWPADHEYPVHRWGMVVDLQKCTGCAGCVVACNLENNVPVVGRDEVARRRELHWLRIDRYYTGDPAEPDTAQQPLMCHHCDNAPCEVVCPVLATVHSSEGLNQQVYNRCVGTRYCANNCPYKVRRFNWFDYPQPPERERLALNPDVTVRSRGVMEKCSFCVQRIQAAKLRAKLAGRELRDGDVQPACAQSCPAGAIIFGDLNDPDSRVSRLARDPRHYQLLDELNVKPSVGYLRLVRHRPEGGKPHA